MPKFTANFTRASGERINSSELGAASQAVIMAMRGVGKATRATYKAGELEFVQRHSSEVNTIYQLKYTLPRPHRRPQGTAAVLLELTACECTCCRSWLPFGLLLSTRKSYLL